QQVQPSGCDGTMAERGLSYDARARRAPRARTVTQRQLAAEFDLAALPAAFYANPYPYYHALCEHAPVKRMRDGSWFLTRYDDMVGVYRDPKTFSSDKKSEFAPKYGVGTPLYEHHTTSLVFNDPPLHTRVRRSILGALSQRHVAAMEPGLIALVGHLLDTM